LTTQNLPIHDVIAELKATLAVHTRAVLIAPPGAGKTTFVPLVLIDEPWCAGQKVLILEPRRLAARAAATRMASLRSEEVGDSIGLRVRYESLISANTRIEVITEGVFMRLLHADPELKGIAAVIFDEFHERSLDADLGLALALDVQGALRTDLRVMVMSATLEGGRVSALLGDAPVILSEGRAFPVQTIYEGRDPHQRIEEVVCKCVDRALYEQEGSLLVFLPGQAEIRRVHERLIAQISDPHIRIHPLYGTLDKREQDEAIAPASKGVRKIVLATSIAESSLNIEGVRVVIDSGLARIPIYEPDVGLTRLETVRASRASVDQRQGRAGRTTAGVCYRLWLQSATGALPAYADPEIKQADLSALVLTCAAWGETNPARLSFLDPPPAPALKEAKNALVKMGALQENGCITAHGRALLAFPLPPRLGHMVLTSQDYGLVQLACDLALLIVERGLGGDDRDLRERLMRLKNDKSTRAQQAKNMAKGWQKSFGSSTSSPIAPLQMPEGLLIAMAYPHQIAMRRVGKFGEYQLANGRTATLDSTASASLAAFAFLAIAEVAGRAQAARIISAAPLSQTDFETVFASSIFCDDQVLFDESTKTLRARRIRQFQHLILSQQPLPVPRNDASIKALLIGMQQTGINGLLASPPLVQWCARVMFLRNHDEASWPDVSKPKLLSTLDMWLSPFLAGKTALDQLSQKELLEALETLLPHGFATKLTGEAPAFFEAPTGSHVVIDYTAEGGPCVHLRVQELYGLKVHPCISNQRIPLVMHLLSPAHRPIQVTKDIVGFWQGSWAAVKSEMKGRYPKHVWPDNPAEALATTRAKPRGS
jgi:ATP-dependent helicase HrpB